MANVIKVTVPLVVLLIALLMSSARAADVNRQREIFLHTPDIVTYFTISAIGIFFVGPRGE